MEAFAISRQERVREVQYLCAFLSVRMLVPMCLCVRERQRGA